MELREVLPRDAIPSVDDPAFGPAGEYDGDPEEEVIVLDPATLGDSGDPPRAYPVRYLHYHEVVNDTVAGQPVAVTWCPLCGSAVVYDRRVDGRTLTFGVSGKLADDDLVLYDRETDSEWKQSLGRCIAGELAGAELTVLPASVTGLRAVPDGAVVLQPPGGASEAASDTDEPAEIDYDAEPYERYFSMEGFGLDAHRGQGGREWDRGDGIGPKDVVLGVVHDGEALGFPAERVELAGGLARATVGGEAVVVLATPEGIHAYRDPGVGLERVGPGRFAGDGTAWDGATGEAADGRTLERLPARRLFAFAWQDDHGPDAFWSPA
jgi:hypothetical protein